MKLLASSLALTLLACLSGIQSASAQVVIERSVIAAPTLDLSIDRLLGPGVFVVPGVVTRTVSLPAVLPSVTTEVITVPRVLTHSAVIESSLDSTYKPGIYLPGRYSGSRVLDLDSVVLPTTNF